MPLGIHSIQILIVFQYYAMENIFSNGKVHVHAHATPLPTCDEVGWVLVLVLICESGFKLVIQSVIDLNDIHVK